MSRRDITQLLQQRQNFENRLSVRLTAISAFEEPQDDGESRITVRGELHSTDGDTISADITLKLSIYDAAERVIETTMDYIEQDLFFGLHTFELSCEVTSGTAAKLQLVPTL